MLVVSGADVPVATMCATARHVRASIAASAGGGATSAVNGTIGIPINAGASAAGVAHGRLVLTLHDAATFTWVAGIAGGFSSVAAASTGGATKALSQALDRVQFITTDTFDAGTVSIVWE